MLAAVKKGILPCLPAGIFGPQRSIIFNDAPGILTVGASTMDRRNFVPLLLDLPNSSCQPKQPTPSHGRNPTSNLHSPVQKPHYVHLQSDQDLVDYHKSFLPTNLLYSGEPHHVHSHRHVISGFATRLTRDEVLGLELIDGFL